MILIIGGIARAIMPIMRGSMFWSKRVFIRCLPCCSDTACLCSKKDWNRTFFAGVKTSVGADGGRNSSYRIYLVWRYLIELFGMRLSFAFVYERTRTYLNHIWQRIISYSAFILKHSIDYDIDHKSWKHCFLVGYERHSTFYSSIQYRFFLEYYEAASRWLVFCQRLDSFFSVLLSIFPMFLIGAGAGKLHLVESIEKHKSSILLCCLCSWQQESSWNCFRSFWSEHGLSICARFAWRTVAFRCLCISCHDHCPQSIRPEIQQMDRTGGKNVVDELFISIFDRVFAFLPLWISFIW